MKMPMTARIGSRKRRSAARVSARRPPGAVRALSIRAVVGVAAPTAGALLRRNRRRALLLVLDLFQRVRDRQAACDHLRDELVVDGLDVRADERHLAEEGRVLPDPAEDLGADLARRRWPRQP